MVVNENSLMLTYCKGSEMIKKVLGVMFLTLALSVSVFADEWTIDKTHSSVSFKVRHMVVSKVKGGFDDFSGTVQFDGSNLTTGSVEMTIDVASIDTDDAGRDKHLVSADFFDAATFPKITFKSKKVIADGDNYKIVGDMTMKDVTKEVTFDVEFSGTVDDPWGNTRAGFSASTTIDRQEFNVSFSKTLDNGGLVVGNDVEIELELEIVKAKPEGEEKK